MWCRYSEMNWYQRYWTFDTAGAAQTRAWRERLPRVLTKAPGQVKVPRSGSRWRPPAPVQGRVPGQGKQPARAPEVPARDQESEAARAAVRGSPAPGERRSVWWKPALILHFRPILAVV